METESFLVYFANWAKTQRDAKDIIHCDAWVDSETGCLRLDLTTHKGKPNQRHLALELDQLQFKRLVRLMTNAGVFGE